MQKTKGGKKLDAERPPPPRKWETEFEKIKNKG